MRGRTYSITAREKRDITVRAVVPQNDGVTLAKVADIERIEAYVYDLRGDTPSTPTFIEHIPVGDVIFDTPQTSTEDPGWKGGTPGLNFRWVASALFFPKGGAQYRVEILFAMVRQTAYDIDNGQDIIIDVVTEGRKATV